MRTPFFLWLLLSMGAAFAQAPASDPARLDAVMAFARTYGVVRYFHPSDSLDKVNWDRFLVHAAERMGAIDDDTRIGPRLEELFTPIVEGFRVTTPGAPTTPPQGEGPRVEWRHLGYGMEPTPVQAQSPYASWRTFHNPLHGKSSSGGYFQNQGKAEASVYEEPVMRLAIAKDLEAQIPVSLPMSATKVGPAQQARLDALAKTLESVAAPDGDVTRAQAHADGIALWNVARHFYPYWGVVKIDWDEALRAWLGAQPVRQTRAQLRDGLRHLAAPLDDGQARVADPTDRTQRQYLPITIRPAGTQWVIDESRVPDRVKVGDVVVAIDGKPVAQWYAERVALESGSEHHKRWRVRGSFLQGPKDGPVRMDLRRGSQKISAALAYELPGPIGARRLPALQELRSGIFYIDVTHFRKDEFEKSIDAIRNARGIVFDLRGNPSGDAANLVPYWITGVDSAQWMKFPRFDKPFAEPAIGWSFGWQRERDAALEKPAKVLLTDARAISHAESLAAYFPGQKTGPVVGEPTAGANGSVATATLPSGMKFTFTGMIVTRHDGTILHREGIKPDVAVVPTPEGIRAGRDEVLERGLAILEAAAKR
ncbi:MAG: S41 family peptidase [Usitatibacter sp.]